MKLQKTFSPTPAGIDRQWWVVDAADLPLGRLATEVATVLRGKNKPTYAPHMDMGDFVVVINAARVAATGNKEVDKVYYRHSTYPGGLRSETLGELRVRRPQLIIEKAVRGMLPKNKLGRAMLRKLKVYPGPDHPHASQQPRTLEFDIRKVEA